MFLRTALCFAVTLVCAAGKPRPAAPLVLKADPSVPPTGAAGERLDGATGRGRAIPPFLEGRADFQATLCPDGRVLVTGGSGRPTSEWFDPATNRFSPGPALTVARQGHRALLLKDGRVLLLGGTATPSPAEVLAPGGEAFKPVPDVTFALSAEAVELDEGKVFMLDGASGAIYVWDGRRAPSARATLQRPRNFARALRMKDGRVAITGGWPSDQKVRGRRPATGPSLPVECFNPRWSSLSSWSALPQPRARHQAALLEDGRLCLWGGVGQDPDVTVTDLEVLDPVKETVTKAGALDLRGGPSPAWALDGAGQGLALGEGGQRLLRCPTPLALPAAEPAGRLANGYLGPILVPLKDGGVLVLGTPSFGAPVDHWDAKTRQVAVVGTLRQGIEDLGLLPDGRVLALGPVVDLLEPRTGALTPLGWREDLGKLLATLLPAPKSAGLPPFAPGQERQDALVVPLDRTHALVVEGSAADGPSGELDLWDLRKKALVPAGTMKIRRAQPRGLKLKDGSVLVWGAGRE